MDEPARTTGLVRDAATTSAAKSVRDAAERIRQLGRSAAMHAGNAATLLRLAAAESEQTEQRRR